MNVDATILVAVQNGYAESIYGNSGPALTPGTGSLWVIFFDELDSDNPNRDRLIGMWGDAEQAATNYAISSAKWGMPKISLSLRPGNWVLPIDDIGFVVIGNIYRWAGGNYCSLTSCVGGFFDPTVNDSYKWWGGPYENMSPVGRALGIVYAIDYYNR